MPKVTFSTPTVVAVKIRGEGGSFPMMPNDGGVIMRFQKWAIENDIFTMIPGGSSGGGGYLGYYSEEDAEKIRKWLLENGVAEDDDATWGSRV
jgi:hypothetical protein